MTALITRDELSAAIDAGTVTVLDTLGGEYYAHQHLPGAHALAPADVDARLLELLLGTAAGRGVGPMRAADLPWFDFCSDEEGGGDWCGARSSRSPRRARRCCSHRLRSMLRPIEMTRMIRMSGYIVALSKLL